MNPLPLLLAQADPETVEAIQAAVETAVAEATEAANAASASSGFWFAGGTVVLLCVLPLLIVAGYVGIALSANGLHVEKYANPDSK